jgi:hypothetical protein
MLLWYIKNMESRLSKTTVYFEKPLLYLAKKKALDEGKSLKQIMKEALTKYLGLSLTPVKKSQIKFGGYDLGEIKGNLDRKEIYDHF